MSEILTKISSYDLFNNLFPGTLFIVLAEKLLNIPLIQESVLVGIFLYYFVGMIISRFGSLIIAPILKKIKLAKFEDYKDYISASKLDDKIDLLSQINNTYRTIISMLILLLLLKLYLFIESYIQFLQDYRIIILLFSLIVMFIFSYKKQTKFITKRIKASKK
ncbi:hypothetical protein [Winogradskyella ursingii]|uniref:hypothetical protein n=1 Tax=Winogradskyella ursingii TaxID=2686079 RepID=UPI0015C76D21|nr:hypothetical protein [Winogradskyella ursingii]